jgi:hypothetical protein
MLFCDRIYNMTEFTPYPENPELQPEHREHTDPETLEHSIDTLMQNIWDRPQLERALDGVLDRQKELVEQLHDKRERGERLTAAEESELDEINGAILSIQHLFERYDSRE